jgi:acylphosphatase
MKKHISLKVSGGVQGVGFRLSAKIEADRLCVTGFVMNCDDGSVCIEAEGEDDAITAFADWCRTGPDGARVQRVDLSDGVVCGHTVFEIRREQR